MIRVTWQDISYEVHRLVISEGLGKLFRAALDPVIERFGLVVTDETAEPQPGDFWIGCSPTNGWQNADPARTAWASAVEVREAVVCLTVTLPRHRRAVSVSPFGIDRFRHYFALFSPTPGSAASWV